MANELVERDGRYFIQCYDGEIETTIEELKQIQEGRKRLLAYLEMSQKMYGHQNWTVGTTPPNTDFHVILALYFEEIKELFQERYHAGKSLWNAYKMCDVAILSAKESLLNPHADAERENAWLGRWQALREFLDVFPKRGAFDETPPFATPAPPVKGTAADVRRYFPKAATIHGTTATDANALHQLAVWLLHWAEQPKDKRYSLASQLREQQAAHLNAGKFLKACRRLHEALTPLAATEQETKTLLGGEYTVHSCNNLKAVLKWWAGWIKEQQAAHDDPAGAYLAALRRVPVVEVWENGSPGYTIPAHLVSFNGFEAEIAPLRRLFEAALPDLPTEKKQALHGQLNELLDIDRAGLQRRRKQSEQGEYGLNLLPADYSVLHFDVAGQPDRFKWQSVSPLFWGGLMTLLQYKQVAARAAYEQLMPTPASHLAPTAPVVNGVTTVEALCRPPFTPPDLNELLVRLAVIDTTGRCLTNDLQGKARGKRGAFTAAYRVLHRAGLLAPTATDREWATAFKNEYGAELGADVIAHKLTQHGQALSLAPGPFQQAVTDAAEWVDEWESRQKG